jgi:hypothetical protein
MELLAHGIQKVNRKYFSDISAGKQHVSESSGLANISSPMQDHRWITDYTYDYVAARQWRVGSRRIIVRGFAAPLSPLSFCVLFAWIALSSVADGADGNEQLGRMIVEGGLHKLP